MQKKYLQPLMICLGLVGTTFGMIQPAPCFPPKGYPGQDDLEKADKNARAAQKYNPVSKTGVVKAGTQGAYAANSLNKTAEKMDKEVDRIMDQMSK